MPERLAVAWSGSVASERALAWAVDAAQRSGTGLLVFTVIRRGEVPAVFRAELQRIAGAALQDRITEVRADTRLPHVRGLVLDDVDDPAVAALEGAVVAVGADAQNGMPPLWLLRLLRRGRPASVMRVSRRGARTAHRVIVPVDRSDHPFEVVLAAADHAARTAGSLLVTMAPVPSRVSRAEHRLGLLAAAAREAHPELEVATEAIAHAPGGGSDATVRRAAECAAVVLELERAPSGRSPDWLARKLLQRLEIPVLLLPSTALLRAAGGLTAASSVPVAVGG